MKVALCLHGYFNSSVDSTSLGLDGYNHIKQNILDKNDTDVYIHSWDTVNEKVIRTLYKPKLAKFESQKDFTDVIVERGLHKLQNCPRSPQSVLSHLYSVAEVVNLAYTQNELQYDVVVKARFDLGRINRNTSGPGMGNPYPVQCINFQENIQSNKLYMANWNHFHMGPADMWFYGDSNVMRNFTTLYSELYSEMRINSDFHIFAKSIENNEGDLSNSIAFYKWWMIKTGLWENRITLDTVWE